MTFLGLMDYANVMTNWTASINAHADGLEARCFTLLDHPFHYPLKRDWTSGSPDLSSLSRVDRQDPALRRAVEWFEGSDVIVWAAEEGRHGPQRRRFNRLGFRVNFRDSHKHYIVFHAGSIYRKNSGYYNRKDGHFALRLLGPDNAPLAGDDPRVRINRNCYPVLPAATPPGDRLHVNHTPSDPAQMGTPIIQQAVQRVKKRGISFDYEQTSPPVPHDQIMNIFRRSHVHIDQVSPLGVTGMTVLEAAATGNVVLCTYHKMELLKRSLDSWPIIDPGLTVESVEEALAQVLSLSREDLERKMGLTREWFRKNFGFEAVVEWWEEMLAEV